MSRSKNPLVPGLLGYVANPAGGGLRPVESITDRAKRYRANSPDVRPLEPRICNFCLSVRNVEVGHVDGDESDSSPANLVWTCRSCNVLTYHTHQAAGLGRRTAQFNPTVRRNPPSAIAYFRSLDILRGAMSGDVRRAVETVRATPPELRSQYMRAAWRVRRATYGSSGRQSEIPF